MIYKNFQNLKLSALGFRAMRMPIVDENYAEIDESAATEMIDYAIQHGVNYFDTAWGYHDGNSETFIGKALSQYACDSFYLATKFPGYDLSNMDKVESIFEKQLEKCRVSYFDFYMLHNVCEMNIDAYLDEKYGIIDYFMKQKNSGQIRHLGFSAHGSVDVMKRFLKAYGEHMEFCQIQLNYLDWSFQSGNAKMELLKEYNIPVWVMEPLRGGKLAALPEENAAKLKTLRPDEGIPTWAFRFLQTLPDVQVILSGMSNLEQLKDNISTFESEKPLSTQELEVLLDIAGGMVKKIALPCTACRYCTESCPQQLDIPSLLELYNEHCFTIDGGLLAFIAPMALMAVPEDKQPSACTGCGACEAVCPQKIKVSDALADFTAKLGR